MPPAVARYGAFLSPGVVLMPSYVNIGAWVGPNTMVDTWATVGSGAQIGADVHLAGGVGIGGVLEPPGARPVIVEDGAFLGSRCIVVEGVRIGREAVLAPNVTLTASVPIIDVTGPEPVEHRGYVPPRSVVVPGTRPKEFPAGTYHLSCALIIGRRTESTDLQDVAERRAARLRDRQLAHDERQPIDPLARRALQCDMHDVTARSHQSPPPLASGAARPCGRRPRTASRLPPLPYATVAVPAIDRTPFDGGPSR